MPSLAPSSTPASVPRSWMPAAVLALGIISLLLIVATDRIRRQLLERDIVVTRTISEIESGLSVAHLWIEEYLYGDEREILQVARNLDRAAGFVRLLLEGGTLEDSTDLPPTTDERLRFHLMSLTDEVHEFRRIADSRLAAYQLGESVGPGSAADIELDRVFASAVLDIQAMKSILTVRLANNHRRSRSLLWGILLTWIAIVALALTGLASRERRRRQTESALRESQEQLMQAQKMDAIGRLAGGIAHDINNYLAAIMSTCELVKIKAEPGSRLADQMDTVIGTVLRASALIRRLLAFSRRQPVQPQIVDLNRIVSDLQSMLHRLLGEDVELDTVLESRLWPVQIDPSQLEQVLVNLAVNAREAMPSGGRLTIETRNASSGPGKENEVVHLTVRDDGTGIPPEIRDRIFEPFFSTKRGGGSGLGLATVYAIVSQAHGSIAVESETGRGTSFILTFPRSFETPSTAVKPEPAPTTRGSETLLLVEDSQEFRLSIRELLTGMGYRVLAARDGQQALRLLAESPPPGSGDEVRLLISDVVMPGMNGPDLADQVRVQRPDIAILFISGYAADVIAQRGVVATDLEILQKPFTAEELSRKVRQRLEGLYNAGT